MQVGEQWRQASLRQRVLVVVAVLYLVYALLGYFLLSPLLRKEIVTQASALTGRDVQLEHFTFNPLGLAVTAEGFSLKDPDGEDFVAFDELYADFELSSLFRWSWHFDEIALVRPRIRVTQEQDEALNFADIVDRLSSDEGAVVDEEAAEEATGIPAVSVGLLHLDSGNFVFRDEARVEPDEIAFDQLSFDVRDFATAGQGEDDNSYKFEVTGPDGGHFLWEGQLDFNPLVAQGRLGLEGLRLQPIADFLAERLNFSVPEGELDIQTSYRYESAESFVLSLSDGVIRLRGLEVNDRRTGEQVIAAPELVVSGIALDTRTETLTAAELALAEPSLGLRMTPEGLDLASLFVLKDVAEENEVVAVPEGPAEAADEQPDIEEDASQNADEESGVAWAIMLDAVNINDMALRYRDETLTTPSEVNVAPITLKVTSLSPNEGKTFTFEGSATVAAQGQLGFKGDGELTPLRVRTDLSVDQLPLTAATPWLQESLAIELPQGALQSALSVTVSQQGEDVSVSVTGSSSISDFAMQEENGTPMVSFAGLKVDGISMDTAASRLSLDEIAFDQLAVNSVIDEQGRNTADRIVIPVAAAADDGSGEDWRVLVGRLSFANGTIESLNQSLSPDFRVGVYELNGALSNLDSASRTPAKLNLTAKIDKYAPLSVKGTMNPLATKPQADVYVKLEGYEMTSLTPFTGEYLGYAVSSGQLGLDTEVLLDNTYLDCKNRIHAANFFLGDKVESEEALKVPIKLGLAVLRNRDGNIELPVEAKGDLSDPNVSARGIILKALGNVLVKAATSPFSMLGALAGGADLSAIPYPAGSAQLDSSGRENLQKLVKVMTDRPALKFTLAGSVVEADRFALASANEAEALSGGGWQGIDQAVTESGFRRRLGKRYESVTGKSLDAFAVEFAAMTEIEAEAARQKQARDIWAALIQFQQAQLGDDALQELAAQRAQLAKTVLVEELQQDAGRLFIANPVLDGQEAAQGVVLGLAGN